MLAAAAGIIPYSLGFIIKFFQLLDPNQDVGYVAVFLLTIGWYPMVTGEQDPQNLIGIADHHRPIYRPLVSPSSAQQFAPRSTLDPMDDHYRWCRLALGYYCFDIWI